MATFNFHQNIEVISHLTTQTTTISLQENIIGEMLNMFKLNKIKYIRRQCFNEECSR